jgi:uncharacterized protein
MKIWLDFCEPKSITMLRPLYNRLTAEHDVFITARDFDATYSLLDDWGVPYLKVGHHGGKNLNEKLHSYIDRLNSLLPIIEREKPDFLFCITSPEAIRIAFGLGIPHIMFYDEPRSVGCSKLTLSMVEHLVVPGPIPYEWYGSYGIAEDKVVRFNGIDEVAWLNRKDFHPNTSYNRALGLEEKKYIVCRTEATQSYSHLDNWLGDDETLLLKIIPALHNRLKQEKIDMKFFILPRYQEQFDVLLSTFEQEIADGTIILKKSIANLADIMYYSAMVLSGGGTMVRESGLLGIPSIEFIPSKTYPQEQFLIDNNFPLLHVQTVEEVVEKSLEFLKKGPSKNTWDRIDDLDNPITIALDMFEKIVNI